MSFSNEIKQELNKNSNLGNKIGIKYELIGYLMTDNISFVGTKDIKFVTESEYNINRYSKLLLNLDILHKIEVIGKTFAIKCKYIDIEKSILDFEKIFLIKEQKNKNKEIIVNIEVLKEKEIENLKNIVKGTFLGSGTINDPNKNYHLDINLSNRKNLELICQILDTFSINVKVMNSEEKFIIYIKEAEEISKLLALIGANKAVLEFEEIRIERQMRGKVNRLVNCETANLNKTLNASIEQVSAIDKLEKNGMLSSLDDNLKEIAYVRRDNPDMSLIELGKLLSIPIGKSGVNYRLKKIIEIANDIK